MPGRSRHLIGAAAAVLLIALAAPTAAFADGGSKCTASACKVYHEGGVPGSGQHQQPTKGPTGSNTGGRKLSHHPKTYRRVLAQAGKDKAPLKNLFAGDATIGSLRSTSSGSSPSLLGAAFDLGAGPTILLAILLGVGIGLAARGRLGGLLGKRSSS
jgi:hypothetical protein